MTRRKKTDGERIAKRAFSGRYESRGMAFPSELAVEIDRLVRRRMAEAWKGIERQRDENARLRADVPVYSSVIEQKRFEIKRLREALKDIDALNPDVPDALGASDLRVIVAQMGDRAVKALEAEP